MKPCVLRSLALFVSKQMIGPLMIVVCGWAVMAEAAKPIATFSLRPARTGQQLVRCSLPCLSGALVDGQRLAAFDGQKQTPVALRALTYYPQAEGAPRSVRRVLVTFPYPFDTSEPVEFRLVAANAGAPAAEPFAVEVEVDPPLVRLRYPRGEVVNAQPVMPSLAAETAWKKEVVEEHGAYRWERWQATDAAWSEIIEVRQDVLGQVVLVAHLQRRENTDPYSPALGWSLKVAPAGNVSLTEGHQPPQDLAPGQQAQHRWSEGQPASLAVGDSPLRIAMPAAALQRCGQLAASRDANGELVVSCLQATVEDKVPLEFFAWRRAAVTVSPAGLADLGPTLLGRHEVRVPAQAWQALYDLGPPLDLAAHPKLQSALAYHHEATLRCVPVGLDWGTVTGFADSAPTGSVFGMDRLNHCRPIYLEGLRSQDRRLVETAVAWCDNFHDLSIWWGPKETGGARYHDLRAMNQTPPNNDQRFRWRSNHSVHFCTKGFESFFLIYEETGDPRMLEALQAQVHYAKQYLHAGQNGCRNIGDVADLVHLYHYTLDRSYLENALRLFGELRARVGPDHLFSESGLPIVADPPFINDDALGYRYPYAKPYIIGYALNGLPELLGEAPDEPLLREVVTAVCDFLAASQDPVGGWRYPHPASTSLIGSQGIEHAWQIAQAAQVVGVTPERLDAIERTLRQRILVWLKTGQTFGGLGAWELATGKIKQLGELDSLYKHPADRDAKKDYDQGEIGMGGSAVEGIVYFPEVLRFYLQHRPAERLLAAPAPEEPLGKVLARLKEKAGSSP